MAISMTSRISGLQPSVLRWAREAQGYSLEDVALRLKRDLAEITAWETGESGPTYAQLEKLAYEVYKRPLAVFFLPEPPLEQKVKQEFRTLPDSDLDELTADTRYQLRLAHAHQISLRELNDGVNPAEHKIFRDIPLSENAAVLPAASAVREYLGISLATQSRWGSSEQALKVWRNAVEAAGIFVFKHPFKQRTISGFSLVDDEFPVIYLNNSAAKTRQTFSLFHELAHLLLHGNSISMFDDRYIEQLPPPQRRIEQFCNAFAAEVLMPSDDFIAQLAAVGRIDDQSVQKLADRYRVSREAVLRRILDRGMVAQAYYEAKVRQWAEEAEDGASGGTYYANQSTYLGDRYLQLVFSKHYQGGLTLEQVADYLGVKSKSVAGLEELMLRKAV